METKQIATKAILGDDAGRLTAVFSTFGIPDRDGDIVEAGAIPDGQDVPMVWAHDWSQIVGRGVTRVDDHQAVFEGQLFLNTAAGQSAYETIKAMDNLMEYSWGFRVIEADVAKQDDAVYRVIKRTELFEVSPVLVGAGIGTGTLSLKQNSPFADHGVAVLAAVDDYVVRARSLADLRARERKEGRVLSTASRERLTGIADALSVASRDLKTILKETEPAKEFDADLLWIDVALNDIKRLGDLIDEHVAG